MIGPLTEAARQLLSDRILHLDSQLGILAREQHPQSIRTLGSSRSLYEVATEERVELQETLNLCADLHAAGYDERFMAHTLHGHGVVFVP